ncbi:tetratricopeptide repeat protein [Xenorhabdus bovienii]|uniref:tetratricopeptide repeat protein n=1 Tax=Xenorhabdus bovienii TaxID=40576 RepID=UPI0034D76A42
MYELGEIVPQDYQKAMEWYLKASKQGLSTAQNNIGILYRKGRGVPQNYQKAMEWYLKAAKVGNAVGMFNVGYLYQSGLGVEKDEQKALEWYQKAAEVDKNFTEAVFAVKKLTKKLNREKASGASKNTGK